MIASLKKCLSSSVSEGVLSIIEFILSKSILGLDPGRRVAHARFGEGKIISVEGNGGSAKVKVNFDQVGVKNLLVKFAKLTLL